MAAAKRGGLGRGLGALIPTGLAESTTNEAEEEEAVPQATPAPRKAALVERNVERNVSRETSRAAVVEEEKPTADVSRETSADDGGLVPVPGASFRLIPIADIGTNPKQPRQIFDEEHLAELQTSLSEVGLLQPIAVRERAEGEGAHDGAKFELVMGERRLRAATALGWETVPAIIRRTADDELLREALLENIHRVQLNPLEEGAAYQQLLEEFNVTQDVLAKRIGRSRPQISNMIRLLSLPAQVQSKVAAGVLTAGHARALLGLDSGDTQEHIAERIISEGLSVRSTEELVTACRLEEKPELDEPPVGSPRPAKDRIKAPGLEELKDRLSDHFETKVGVTWGRKKGKIVIEFGSLSDLDRIVEQIGVE
ncbi:ParB/RepB/Spo0J family partition protein [Glycomyces buryatensis]|uniref:ParB/RepB/Spo0J family partition protein n=1 Tax=Glycomyces buryatensis TaxID=2570927 RepID=A0A4S8Q8K8_9ACTN|nr:ParB/RepB/Spo0J family partition protein [Glycomyces buryatensis]THV40608.1 ParB/RepB/Spo0J family partition protein [Glycomyces buryatensis]